MSRHIDYHDTRRLKDVGIIEGSVSCPHCAAEILIVLFVDGEDCPACGASLGLYAEKIT